MKKTSAKRHAAKFVLATSFTLTAISAAANGLQAPPPVNYLPGLPPGAVIQAMDEYAMPGQAVSFPQQGAMASDPLAGPANAGKDPAASLDSGRLGQMHPYDPTEYQDGNFDPVPEAWGPDGDQRAEDALPPDLNAVLANALPNNDLKANLSPLRYNAIRQAGYTYGMQAGLARQTALNMQSVKQRSRNLDQLYNFQALMLPGNVLPPVLAEMRDIYDQTSPEVLNLGNLNYQILAQARFTHTPPTWRTYLMRAYRNTYKPPVVLNPSKSAERALWDQSVKEGFGHGQHQANTILRESWRMLHRDFSGMALYRTLLEEGVVTAPYVVTAQKDVIGDSRNMTVGVTELRISAMPELKLRRSDWKPSVGSQSARGYLSNKGAGLGTGPLPSRSVDVLERDRYGDLRALESHNWKHYRPEADAAKARRAKAGKAAGKR